MRFRNASHHRHALVVVASVVLLFPAVGAAEVAVRDGGEQAAVMKAQTMLREMAMEKEALQAERTQLEGELAKRDKKIESLNGKIERITKSLNNSSDTVNRYQDTVTLQRERMEEMRGKFQKLVDKYRELVAALKLVEAERVAMQETAAHQSDEIGDCGKKNDALYQAALDMIEKYENKGVWDALLQKEPVTQLKRVEIENIVDDAKFRIDMLKVVDVGMTPE
jgi:chromosome segregation ATPase